MEYFKTKEGEIHIGLVMAGAVTAGAFTGGVMDYLLNSLESWQQAYQNNDPRAPRPNVKIDTMTGASAGSIAAAVTLIGLLTKQCESVDDDPKEKQTNNLHYDTWVKFGLNEGETIIDKIFETGDIGAKGDVKSLLNTGFMDDIILQIKKLVEETEELCELPPYINNNLEILMTLSNLRGIPIDLSFSQNSKQVVHSMTYHKAFTHFEYNKEGDDAARLPLDLKIPESLHLFLNSARASGAFPIGLKAVPFKKISKDYIKANLKQIFGEEVSLNPRIKGDYEFLAVDGGMTNNEPIAEAIRILKSRKTTERTDTIRNITQQMNMSAADINETFKADVAVELNQKNPIILIDPFPSYVESMKRERKEYQLDRDNIFQLVPQLLSTLRNQVLFKENDIVDLFSDTSNRKMIWPTRYDETGKKLSNPIATGGMGGFTGFFDKSFRHHDYMLGKKNCQNFVRYYFNQSIEDAEASGWTAEQIEEFHIIDKDTQEKRVPIIPDFRITGREKDRSFLPKIEEDNFPDWPQVDEKQFIKDQLKPKLKNRVDGILKSLLSSKTKAREKSMGWLNWKNFFVLIPIILLLWPVLLFGLIPMVRRYYVRKLTLATVLPKIAETIRVEMEEHGLFKKEH